MMVGPLVNPPASAMVDPPKIGIGSLLAVGGYDLGRKKKIILKLCKLLKNLTYNEQFAPQNITCCSHIDL